ncbi:MAG: hypothetical protein GON13_04030 [Nanoarchaeota archaeon]|nr:hypothetical protein [Nanoarchaeota archaeon]
MTKIKRAKNKVKSASKKIKTKAVSAKERLAKKKRWLVFVLLLITLLVLMNINRLEFTFL